MGFHDSRKRRRRPSPSVCVCDESERVRGSTTLAQIEMCDNRYRTGSGTDQAASDIRKNSDFYMKTPRSEIKHVSYYPLGSHT